MPRSLAPTPGEHLRGRPTVFFRQRKHIHKWHLHAAVHRPVRAEVPGPGDFGQEWRAGGARSPRQVKSAKNSEMKSPSCATVRPAPIRLRRLSKMTGPGGMESRAASPCRGCGTGGIGRVEPMARRRAPAMRTVRPASSRAEMMSAARIALACFTFYGPITWSRAIINVTSDRWSSRPFARPGELPRAGPGCRVQRATGQRVIRWTSMNGSVWVDARRCMTGAATDPVDQFALSRRLLTKQVLQMPHHRLG